MSHVMSHVTCRLQTTCFNNRDVETSVAAALKSNGVEVYSGFLLARYNENEEQSDEVRYMAFTSNTRPLRLECRAFISFYRKMVDLDAFQGHSPLLFILLPQVNALAVHTDHSHSRCACNFPRVTLSLIKNQPDTLRVIPLQCRNALPNRDVIVFLS